MTPEQEEQVRRALAATAAREAAPTMPPDVVARLDGVLGELVAPRRAAAEPDDERPDDERRDELAARRRRRWPRVLGAAAAVSVIAVGGAAVVTGELTRSGQSESSTAGRASSPADDGGAESQGLLPSGVPEPAGKDGPAAVGTPRLRTATLRRDVQRVVDGGSAAATLGGRRQPGLDTGRAPADSSKASCAVPAAGRGDRLLAVRLDGRAATMLLGPVRNGMREARLYSCDSADRPVARTVVRR